MSRSDVYKRQNQDREDFKYVGTWDHPGRQSWDMVSGAAKYPTDLWMDGTLTAMALRCPYGHAKVKSLDISEAEKMEGVKLVLTYEDEELASMPRYRPAYYQLGASPVSYTHLDVYKRQARERTADPKASRPVKPGSQRTAGMPGLQAAARRMPPRPHGQAPGKTRLRGRLVARGAVLAGQVRLQMAGRLLRPCAAGLVTAQAVGAVVAMPLCRRLAVDAVSRDVIAFGPVHDALERLQVLRRHGAHRAAGDALLLQFLFLATTTKAKRVVIVGYNRKPFFFFGGWLRTPFAD